MPLTAKTKLGPYEVIGQIGAGGMGEVYRARDIRLERTVAIKILPSGLSTNSSLKQRFEREAKTISNLSHPHICTLHDVGHENGIDYLVMEYLEGQTLADRLSRGPLSIDEVLRYAVQVCDALDKAHRQGIVHRDLKPGNIMLTKHGVKLLDFGLAKWTTAESPIEVAATAELTLKQSLTEQGTILGTVQYMAPEQLEGKEADARTDIFAFGAVLYEMVSGKNAFSGKSRASIMAAILERDPERLSQVAPLIPPALDRVVAGCLAKDPEERWQTAHDLKLQLKWILEGGSETGLPKPLAMRRWRPELVAWGVAAIMGLVAVHFVFFAGKPDTVPRRVNRYQLAPPAGTIIHSIALSPSGRKVAMATWDPDSKTAQLWIQSMDSLNAQPIAGTEGATFPFWSPDESFVAFWARGNLKKVELQNQIVMSLCSAPGSRGSGGTWGSKGTILFASSQHGRLYQVASTGGAPLPLTDPSASELRRDDHPFFLPDGEHFLFWKGDEIAETTVGGAFVGSGGIYVASVTAPGQARPLLKLNSTGNGIYAAGHLIYYENKKLMAAPFDPEALRLTGASFPIADGVGLVQYYQAGVFSAAADGTLIYSPDPRTTDQAQLTWYDTDGTKLAVPAKSGNFVSAQLSSDGRLICVDHFDREDNHEDIWIWETARNSPVRVTSDRGHDRHAIWSPDGKRIVFSSNRNRTFDLYIKEIASVEPEKLLFQSSENKYPQSWSRDGKHLLFNSFNEKFKNDIWVLHMTEDPPRAERVLHTEHAEERARFSPDGKWVVYESDGQKSREIFVLSFLDRHGIRKISDSGGTSPRWSHDGKRIYYLDLENYLVEVGVEESGNSLETRSTKRLFQIPFIRGTVAPFDLAPDGRRILVNEQIELTNSVPLRVVLNWPVEFERR